MAVTGFHAAGTNVVIADLNEEKGKTLEARLQPK